MSKAKQSHRRFKTIPYIEKDAPEGAAPWRVTMSSDLTMEEVDQIMDARKRFFEVMSAKDMPVEEQRAEAVKIEEELLDLVAIHVVDWPDFYDRQGKPIPPPAKGGGKMFKKVPTGILASVLNDLLSPGVDRFSEPTLQAVERT